MIDSWCMKRNSPRGSGLQEPTIGKHSSQAVKSNADSQPMKTKDAASVGNDMKRTVSKKHFPVPNATSRMQTKANVTRPQSANPSNGSAVGVYSSSSDPVCFISGPAANAGAIRREVGVIGPHRQSSGNSPEPSSSQNTQSGIDGQAQESARSFNAIPKKYHSAKVQ